MNCKNAAILFIIFIIFSFAVCLIPQITYFDILGIKYVQDLLIDFNREIPLISGGILFYIMTVLPIFTGGVYFFVNKMYRNIFLFATVPFLAYFINGVIKIIVHRQRPPLDLQFEEHIKSYSYVSRHTFITACVWGIFIYLVCKYCTNKIFKYFVCTIAAVWIIFEGFTRIWSGVHNPTDVVGALILACVFIIFYIRLIQKLTKVS